MSLWGNGSFLEFDSDDGCTAIDILKMDPLYNVKGECYIFEFYLNIQKRMFGII